MSRGSGKTSGELFPLGGAAGDPAVLADGRWYSYGDLERRAAVIAGRLAALGMKRRDAFAFLLPNSVNIICCYLACARFGFVGVPISQRITGTELAFQAGDSGAAVLVHSDDHASVVDGQRDHLDGVRHILHDRFVDEAAPADPPPPVRAASVAGTSAFCVMYTGGTTGRSKAAIQTRQAWACCLESSVEVWRLSAADRHLIAMPMSHAAWFTAGAALQAGGTVTILRQWDPDRTLDCIEEQGITTLNMIPTMLGDLLRAFEAKPRTVASVRLLTVAGSVLPMATYQRAKAAFGESIGNIYGLTEAAGPVTFLLPSDMGRGKHDSVGKPGRHVELAIIGNDGLPSGGREPGEIGLAGPQVTPGYLHNPEETERAFSGKWFLTGDVGRLDEDGFLYVVDRKKDMIKSGGFNVYPSEVEQTLYGHPDVLECAVFSMPDPKWTEAVHAAVVLRAGSTCSGPDLAQWSRRALSGYKVPKAFHLMAELPRTRFGKFDKVALRKSVGA